MEEAFYILQNPDAIKKKNRVRLSEHLEIHLWEKRTQVKLNIK